MHGDKAQKEREAALKKFSDNECPLMFATDVAARGLDIKGVTHVVNFDMARDVESYVHRIGRTGRPASWGRAPAGTRITTSRARPRCARSRATRGKSCPSGS